MTFGDTLRVRGVAFDSLVGATDQVGVRGSLSPRGDFVFGAGAFSPGQSARADRVIDRYRCCVAFVHVMGG